jgi:hypothetical protein
MSEDDKDAAVAEQLRETFNSGDGKKQIPPERETSPELGDAEAEVIRIVTAVAGAAAKSAFAMLSKGWESLCLVGPNLERLAAAHEKIASEAEIYNRAYEHDVDQRHHSVKG